MLEDKGNTNIYTMKYQKDSKNILTQSDNNLKRFSKSQYGNFREISPQEKKLQADKARYERRKNYNPRE